MRVEDLLQCQLETPRWLVSLRFFDASAWTLPISWCRIRNRTLVRCRYWLSRILNCPFSLFLRGRAHATAFLDSFIEYMDQVHDLRTFGPDFDPFIVRTCPAEIRIVVNQTFTLPQGTFPVAALETLALIFLAISDNNIRNGLFDSWS